MLPSFLKWVKHVGFPDVVRSPEDNTHNLPDHIFLLLCMVQTPSIQRTSTLHKVWAANNPPFEKRPSLFRQLLNSICEYTIGGVPFEHRDAMLATIKALQNVMRTDAFGTGTVMTLEDESIVVFSVFQGLNWELHRTGTFLHDFLWLTEEGNQSVLRVAFERPDNPVEILSNVLSYLLSSSTVDDGHTTSIANVYSALLERSWLRGLSMSFEYGWAGWTDKELPNIHPLHLWTAFDTADLAALYIDGLAVLSAHRSDIFKRVLDDLSESNHLVTLCKAVLLSDVDNQSRLWTLAKVVPLDHWGNSLDDLVSFSVAPQAIDMYSQLLIFIDVGIGGRRLRRYSARTLSTIATTFKWDVEGGQDPLPPSNCAPLPSELDNVRAGFKTSLNNGTGPVQ
ncbi:hypothetical protein CPB85DRAFT_952347 [Mucidula mucida]|nr:hypothetical protein CPB85DRAFT_952347 [Mucidula mucida]